MILKNDTVRGETPNFLARFFTSFPDSMTGAEGDRVANR
jgi:hypothetical protein